MSHVDAVISKQKRMAAQLRNMFYFVISCYNDVHSLFCLKNQTALHIIFYTIFEIIDGRMISGMEQEPKEVKESLEYAYAEVETLKKENAELKKSDSETKE